MLAPGAKLNASFAASMPRSGDLALISQSGAIAAGLVEWAATRAVGFSAVVSLGDSVDVDFGDLLDYFALDRATRAILLYVESIKDARKFMSAARAAARTKPVVVVKSGRHAQGAKAAQTHTGALAGADAVYDAAFRRAGLLRVLDLEELFAAAETLGRLRPFSGKRLAILTNGGGIGVLAVDRLMDLGGTLAGLSPETMQRLDAALPAIWSKGKPRRYRGRCRCGALHGGIRGSARRSGQRRHPGHERADRARLRDRGGASGRRRGAGASQARHSGRSRCSPCGSARTIPPSGAFESAGIPHLCERVRCRRGFMHLVRYREAIDGLMETPPSLPADFSPDVAAARRIVEQRRAAKDAHGSIRWRSPGCWRPMRSRSRRRCFARDADEAAAAAAPLLAQGETVVVKILSPDIVHKSEVGGVRLNLTSEDAVREAAADILTRARALRPQARIAGVTIHPMIVRPKARELIAGIADDPTFGPVVVFGCGGTAVEVINDKALALPPLDLKLARELISRTRVSRILKAYRDVPAADENAVALVLVKLAQLAADLPEIRELDLNPLLADEHGVIAVDARVSVAPVEPASRGPRGHPRFAIRPYPKEWERHVALTGRHARLRAPAPAGRRAALRRRSSSASRIRICACASLRR